jgi:hypothetical protein
MELQRWVFRNCPVASKSPNSFRVLVDLTSADGSKVLSSVKPKDFHRLLVKSTQNARLSHWRTLVEQGSQRFTLSADFFSSICFSLAP